MPPDFNNPKRGDNDLLDLAGTLVNPYHAGIPIDALNGEFLHIPRLLPVPPHGKARGPLFDDKGRDAPSGPLLRISQGEGNGLFPAGNIAYRFLSTL